tara:strand:+ start:93 stop:1610 length:1518 start_codon:yes stop_codon:yes gene_type:complete
MWGSLLLGDEYDIPFDTTGLDLNVLSICNQLSQHPMMKSTPAQQGQSIMGAPETSENTDTGSEGDGSLTPSPPQLDTPDNQQTDDKKVKDMAQKLGGNQSATQPNPAASPLAKSVGWFDTFGKSAESIVKDLRHARRTNKMVKSEIDDLINAVRLMKQHEVNETLKSVSWTHNYTDTIKSMGLNDRDLKSLYTYGDTRKSALVRACLAWEDANARIDNLIENGNDWTSLEKQSWVQAHDDKDAAKKSWSSALHVLDSLNKSEMSWLSMAANQLEHNGQMDARTMVANLVASGHSVKKMTPAKLSGLMKSYGSEVGIIKGVTRNQWMIQKQNGELIIKDPWAYAAGFIDADGYITITKRGEPRVGLVATGERGRVHCEQLHKTLGCGILQLDLKVYKTSVNKSQHRLQFYSKKDVREVLKGIMPHLRLKKNQAESVLEFIDVPSKGMIAKQRRRQLTKLVKWDNWSDKKGDELLSDWGIQAEAVEAWRDPTLMRLAIQAEQLEAIL